MHDRFCLWRQNLKRPEALLISMRIYCLRKKDEFLRKINEVRNSKETQTYFSVNAETPRCGRYYIIYQNPTEEYIEKYRSYRCCIQLGINQKENKGGFF